MDLTKHAHLLAVDQHLGTAAWVVGGIGDLRGLKGDVRRPDLSQDGLHRPLQGKEVHSFAVSAQREHLLLHRQAVGPAREIDAAHLIQLGALVAEVVVPGQDLQHGGEHRGAHDGGILPQRVEDLEGLAAGIVRSPADLVVVGGGNEGVGDDLVIAACTAHRPQGALQLLLRGVAAPGGLAPHEGGGDVVVAVEPGHLLGQIGHGLHVGTPGGHGDLVSLHLEVQLLQDGHHLLGGDVGAQQGVDLLRLQLEHPGLRDVVEDVDDAVHHLAGPQQLHQLTGPLHGGEGVQGVQALLILGAGLGAHAQGQGSAADGGAVEVGGLKDHVRGVGDDLAVQAAHNARQTHGPVLIGNDQHIGIELAHASVQGGELLALLRPADHDLAALHIAVVEGMHGLAVLQHDVVGDVHDVVDGAHAHGPQPLPHPLWGGSDLHVAHHSGGVSGAQVGRRGLHIQQLRQHAGAAALHHRLVEGQGCVKGGGGLPGQADDGEAVGAVGGDLELHHVVVQAHHRLQVVPGFTVLVKDEDAVGDAVGELRLLGVEVIQGADGPSLGVIGHQVAVVEIGTGGGDCHGQGLLAGPEQAAGPAGLSGGLYSLHQGSYHRPINLVPRLDVRGDRGLVLIQGLVVPQDGGRSDDGVGEVPGVQAQLTQAAQHAVGHHAPQLALFDLLAPRQGGLVHGHRHQVVYVDVPGPGDDLHRLLPAHVDLAHPHVVAVRVVLHGQHLAHHHVLDLGTQVVGQLHLGAGQGHGLRKLFIIGLNAHKLAEPLAR